MNRNYTKAIEPYQNLILITILILALTHLTQIYRFPVIGAEEPDTSFVVGSNNTFFTASKKNTERFGVTFNVEPFNAGFIYCDNEVIFTGMSVKGNPSTVCIAKPNKYFLFSFWSEDLGPTSSRLVSTGEDIGFPGLNKSHPGSLQNDSAILSASRHRNYTAHFVALPITPSSPFG